MDYDFQLSRVNASTLLVNYNVGQFTFGGGDAFLQIPQQVNQSSSATQSFGQCSPNVTGTDADPPASSSSFRVALGYGSLVSGAG